LLRHMDQKIGQFILSFLDDRGLPLEGVSLIPLQGDGSKRRFWRIMVQGAGVSLIFMSNPPSDQGFMRENKAYLNIGRHLHQKGLPLPEIHRFDLGRGWFLLEDLGYERLQDRVVAEKEVLPLYEEVLEILLRLQIEGAKGFEPSWTCQTETYDKRVMRRLEADYFRDAFLGMYLGLQRKWSHLEAPFNHLAETCSKAEANFFLHRDFQSRNILIREEGIGIVDWQGGRLGPLAYDLASLLIDPYVALPLDQRTRLYEIYLDMLKGHHLGWTKAVEQYFPYLAIQRNLQILGAFSYLSKKRGQGHFEAYIPPAVGMLRHLLEGIPDPALSPLKALAQDLLGFEKCLDTGEQDR